MSDDKAPGETEVRRYFSFDPDGGIAFHVTAAAAKKRAEDALDEEREVSGDGWSESIEEICWGEVRGGVVETSRRPATEAEKTMSYCEEIVDYALVPVELPRWAKRSK